jgi:hypothetical protein
MRYGSSTQSSSCLDQPKSNCCSVNGWGVSRGNCSFPFEELGATRLRTAPRLHAGHTWLSKYSCFGAG